MELYRRMFNLCVEKFDGKFDKGGVPYIEHCIHVAHAVGFDDVELACIGLGHDLDEDTDVRFKHLIDMGFTYRIANGIQLMSKRGLMPGQYQDNIESSFDTVRVKIADNEHNMDLRRLETVTDKDLQRVAQYHAQRKRLIEVRDSILRRSV